MMKAARALLGCVSECLDWHWHKGKKHYIFCLCFHPSVYQHHSYARSHRLKDELIRLWWTKVKPRREKRQECVKYSTCFHSHSFTMWVNFLYEVLACIQNNLQHKYIIKPIFSLSVWLMATCNLFSIISLSISVNVLSVFPIRWVI